MFHGGLPGILDEEAPAPERAGNEAAAAVLQDLARVLSGHAPLRLVPFQVLPKRGESAEGTPRRWRTVLPLKEIQYLPEDLEAEDLRPAQGRLAREAWRVRFSRPELILDEPELRLNMAFQALWWSIEEGRVENVGLRRHPGAREWLAPVWEADLGVADAAAEREAWAAALPLHLQFTSALRHERWSGKPDPRIAHPAARAALDRLADPIRRAQETDDAERSFRIVRDEVWPLYRELVDEAYEREREKSEGGGGGGGAGGGEDGGEPSDAVKERMEKLEREQRDRRSGDMLNRPEGMSQNDREQAKRDMEKLRRELGEKAEEPREAASSPGPGGSGPSAPAKERAKQRERLSKPDERLDQPSADAHALYKEYHDAVRHLIPVMRAQFEQALRRRVRSRTVKGRRSGDLDPDALDQLPAGRTDVFEETLQAAKSLYRVSLLIDTSVSMGLEKRRRAVEGAVLFMETLEKLPGVSYEIVAFDTKPRVLKAYGERATPNVKASVTRLLERGSGSTQSHVAVQEAYARARMGRGEKLVIMVNDGDPDNNFDRFRYRALVEGAKDVETHGIGLGPGASLVLDLFPPGRGWWLHDAAELARRVREILRAKISGR